MSVGPCIHRQLMGVHSYSVEGEGGVELRVDDAEAVSASAGWRPLRRAEGKGGEHVEAATTSNKIYKAMLPAYLNYCAKDCLPHIFFSSATCGVGSSTARQLRGPGHTRTCTALARTLHLFVTALPAPTTSPPCT